MIKTDVLRIKVKIRKYQSITETTPQWNYTKDIIQFSLHNIFTYANKILSVVQYFYIKLC